MDSRKRRSFMGVIFITLGILLLAPAGPAFAQWSDLGQDTLGDYSVTEAQVADISDGYADGTWRPYTEMKRSHFAKMAMERFGLAQAAPSAPRFPDVPAGHAFFGYIEGAAAAGLIEGYPNGSFGPDNAITREQGAAIIARFIARERGVDLDSEYSSGTVLDSFGDGAAVNIREEMAAAVDWGIMRGTAGNMLEPLMILPRIQGAAMLIRADIGTPPGGGDDGPGRPGGGDDGPADDVVTQSLDAEEGGTVRHPGGATLVIPPGALSEDTIVTIRDDGYEMPNAGEPLIHVSRTYTIDLSGVEALSEIELLLDYDRRVTPADVDTLMLATTQPDGTPWFRSVEIDHTEGRISRELLEQLNRGSIDVRSFSVIYVADLPLPAPTPILQVPYYWQDFLGWCAPTSLSMVLNYHGIPGVGIVSNWFVAGQHQQDAGAGAWPRNLMKDLGVSESLYHDTHWDADLIPDAPFTAYVKRITQGFSLQDIFGESLNIGGMVIPIPADEIESRPVDLVANKRTHAFVAVASSDDSIWLHDSSGAFAGSAALAQELSWSTFKARAMDPTSSSELRTLVINHPARSEAERRGSIELSEGDDGSLIFTSPTGPESHWKWDGDPYEQGYYWSDLSGHFADNQTYANSLFGNVGMLDYSVRPANVTDEQRTYTLLVQIRDDGENVLLQRTYQPTVQAYTRGTAVTGRIRMGEDVTLSEGEYSVQFWLYQDEVFQDAKIVRFAVIPPYVIE